MTIKNKRDFLIGCIFLIGAVAAIIYAQLNIGESELTVARGSMAPESYPNFILWAMMVFSLLLMGSNIRFSSDASSRSEPAQPQKITADKKIANMRAAGGIGLTALYIVLLPLVGYIASSIVMLIAFIWLFGGRNLKVSIPLSVGLSVALYFFFAKVMDILMP